MRGAVQFLGAIALGMIVVGVLAYYGGAKEIGGAIGGLGGLVLAIALPFLILVPVVTDILGTLADLGSDVRSLANREENAPVQGRTDL